MNPLTLVLSEEAMELGFLTLNMGVAGVAGKCFDRPFVEGVLVYGAAYWLGRKIWAIGNKLSERLHCCDNRDLANIRPTPMNDIILKVLGFNLLGTLPVFIFLECNSANLFGKSVTTLSPEQQWKYVIASLVSGGAQFFTYFCIKSMREDCNRLAAPDQQLIPAEANMEMGELNQPQPPVNL